jgi:hypothetical protein
MYELPVDFCERNLIGGVLEMVCVGAYFTRLEFSKVSPITSAGDSFYIGINESVSMCVNGGSVECRADNPSSMALLVMLLLKEIKEVRRRGKASLDLVFDAACILTINGNNSPNYEAYSIQVHGKSVVVV